MSPRPYRLGQREASVARTRHRILQAARELLSSAESPRAFTLDAVARRAGVSRMTVYYQFGSKAGLLEALFDTLASEGGIAGLAEAFQQADAAAALHRFTATFAHFWSSDRDALRRIRALAVLDAELQQVLKARDERRRQGLRVLLARMGVTDGLEDTLGLLYTLTGFEFFDRLAGEDRTPEDVLPAVQDLVLAVVERSREGRPGADDGS